MNQPHWLGSDRWLKVSLLVVVLLNFALMASIWLPQAKHAQPVASEKYGMGGRERDAVQQFLEESLSLTPQQKEKTAELRRAHFLKTDALRKEINSLRRQISDEVFADAPNQEKVTRLATQLGEMQGTLEKLTFAHFSDLLNLCQPEQKMKFRTLIGELLDRLKPPPPNARRSPGEGDRPNPTRHDMAQPTDIAEVAHAHAPLTSNQADVVERPRRPDQGESIGDKQPANENRNLEQRGERRESGQEPPSEFARVQNQIERLRTRLNLSAAQVEKLQPLVEKFARQLDALRGNASGDARSSHDAEKTIRDQRDEAIVALLTPAQKTLFEQLKQERREQNQPREPRRKD